MEVYIVFGVSGSGKSTIGKLLANRLKIPHFDADDFHPKANLDKMKSGQPLNDGDRAPWLERLSTEIGAWSQAAGAVLSCSALKEKYRQQLSSKADDVRWVLLLGEKEVLAERLAARKGHFFNPKLLDSQFKDLEIPTYGCHVDVKDAPDKIIEDIINHFI